MLVIIFIYIPLCFYFILVYFEYTFFIFQFTFHYASTLSEYMNYSIMRNPYLHSIMLLLYRRKPWEQHRRTFIYIPLCFYFIGRRRDGRDCKKGFTFHYASTLSTTKDSSSYFKMYLHSIMLLLYLQDSSLITICIRIYIPLCFYFIYFQEKFWLYLLLFTFHYASTLSKLAVRLESGWL